MEFRSQESEDGLQRNDTCTNSMSYCLRNLRNLRNLRIVFDPSPR